jgi:sugar phosphate isomerase/epimerase
MRFGICNEIFQDWKLDDAMAFAKKAGYDGIEIAPFTLAKHVTDVPASERTRIRDTAARLELEISGIHWVLVQAEGMYLNHPESEVRTRTARYF